MVYRMEMHKTLSHSSLGTSSCYTCGSHDNDCQDCELLWLETTVSSALFAHIYQTVELYPKRLSSWHSSSVVNFLRHSDTVSMYR